MRHETRHAHDDLAEHGDETGWHFHPAHPRPKPRDSIRDCEIWCDRVPLIVVPLSQTRNGASVVRKVLDLHNALSRFSGFTHLKSCRRHVIHFVPAVDLPQLHGRSKPCFCSASKLAADPLERTGRP
jgi:hypothetical protein